MGPSWMTNANVDKIPSHAHLRYSLTAHRLNLIHHEQLEIGVRLAFGQLAAFQKPTRAIFEPTPEHIRARICVFLGGDVGRIHRCQGLDRTRSILLHFKIARSPSIPDTNVRARITFRDVA
jgi:hypothetical protein